MTATPETTPAVPEPPADLQDSRRLWNWMFTKAAMKGRMSEKDRYQLLHHSLVARDRAMSPPGSLSDDERYQSWAAYFEGQRRLGLIEEATKSTSY